jgi:hypothetical protein
MVAIKDRALDMYSGAGNFIPMARDVGKLAPAPASARGEGLALRFQAGLGAYSQGSTLPEVPGQASGYSFRLAPETIQQQSGFLERSALNMLPTLPQAYASGVQAFASSTAQQTL